MNILETLMDTLDFNTSVMDIRQGVFHTAVQTRRVGLAATLPRDALRQDPPMVRKPGSLTDNSPKELAALAASPRLLEAAMGMATINSLLSVDEDKCRELNAAHVIAEKGADRDVAIVGHFPFIKKLRNQVNTLWVIENNPREGDLDAAQADTVIPKADVVAITGTAMTNHTLDHLLSLCAPTAFVIMLGDTVPMSPVLFDFGVDALSGTVVVDPDLALKCVSQGANFRQIRGTRRLTMFKNGTSKM